MKQFYPLSTFLTEYSEKNGVNAYRPVAVGRYGIRTRESIYSKELAKDYSKNKLIHKNTLTVGMGSVQIDIGVLTDDITYSVSPAYHTYKIAGVNAEYLRYCLECRNQDMFSRFVKRGSRQGKTIDLKRWMTYEIPVYDENRQQEIVDRLNRISELIEKRQEQLVQLSELVKSRFIELFGDSEFNTMQWPTEKLSELCVVSSSKRIYQNEQSTEGVPFLRISDLNERIDNVKNAPELFIPINKYNELKENGLVPTEGDILVTSRGTLGRCYIVRPEDEFYFQDGMISWLSDLSHQITSLYLSQLFAMSGIQKQIASLQAGSTVAYLSISMLKKLDIMLPPLNLQNQFAVFVEQTDKSKYYSSLSFRYCQAAANTYRQEWMTCRTSYF